MASIDLSPRFLFFSTGNWRIFDFWPLWQRKLAHCPIHAETGVNQVLFLETDLKSVLLSSKSPLSKGRTSLPPNSFCFAANLHKAKSSLRLLQAETGVFLRDNINMSGNWRKSVGKLAQIVNKTLNLFCLAAYVPKANLSMQVNTLNTAYNQSEAFAFNTVSKAYHTLRRGFWRSYGQEA